MTPTVKTTITLDLSQSAWTDEWDTSINPNQATTYGHLATSTGLMLQMYSKIPYGGWLCKGVCPLPLQAKDVTFNYALIVDPAIISAQVVETDMKITDSAGWTYDGSFQWNVAKGWMAQVGNPWVDTGVKAIPPVPGVPMVVSVSYKMDYSAHSIRINSVTVDNNVGQIGVVLPAKQCGWAKSEIVTQLQQCSNANPGGYSLAFPYVSYVLS